MRAVWAGLAVLGLAGCGSAPLWLPLPRSDASTMVLAVDGQAFQVIDLSAGPLVLSRDATSERPIIEAWVYRQPAAELRLVPGPLEVVLTGEELMVPDGAYRVETARGERDWTSVAPESSSFFGKRFRVVSKCASFEVSSLAISPREGGGIAAATLGEGRVLFSMTTGELWAVTTTDSSSITLSGAPSPYVTGMTSYWRDQMVLGFDDGNLSTARLEGSTLIASPLGVAARSPRMMTGTSTSELFVVGVDPDTRASEFGRFDGRVYHRIEAFNQDTPGRDAYGGVTTRYPGMVLAGRSTTPYVIVLQGSVLTHETPSDAPSDLITAVADIPAYGAVVGTIRGSLFARSSRGWSKLTSPGNDEAITALIPYETGLMFATVSARFGYLTPEHGLCTDRERFLPNHAFLIAQADLDHWIVVGGRPVAAGRPQAGIIHRLP
ncbi:MAG: hypothetical protein U1E65_20970 [Myxococcota bacterium]